MFQNDTFTNFKGFRIRWFRSVVVITSALHAEGREFEPRRNLKIIFGRYLKMNSFMIVELYFLIFFQQSCCQCTCNIRHLKAHKSNYKCVFKDYSKSSNKNDYLISYQLFYSYRLYHFGVSLIKYTVLNDNTLMCQMIIKVKSGHLMH